jgi:Cell wall-associated hydrolases (invasion-associated proteins)
MLAGMSIHRKEYKAKDKKVQKFSRDGLVEVNIRSQESASASRREKENVVQKAEDCVRYGQIRRHGRSTGRKKRKCRRLPGAGTQNRECVNSKDGIQGHLRQAEAAAVRQDFEVSGKEAVYGKEPGQTQREADSELWEQQGVCLKDEQAYGMTHPACRQEEGRECTQESAEACMDAQETDSRYFRSMDAQETGSRYFRSMDSTCRQPCRSNGVPRRVSMQPARMEGIRKQPEESRKDKLRNKQELYRKEKQEVLTEKSRSSTFETNECTDADGSGGMACQECTDAGIRDSSGGTVYNGSSDSSGGMVYNGCADSMPDSRQKFLHQRQAAARQMIAGSPAGRNRTGTGDAETVVSKENVPGETVTAGTESGTDGSVGNSRKCRQAEKDRQTKGGRLVLEEKDSGMVRGFGMGIAKHAAYCAFREVEESGSIGSDDAGIDDTGEEIVCSRQRAVAAGALRRRMQSRSAGMAKCRHHQEKNRYRMRMEQDAEPSETGTGQQHRGCTAGKNLQDTVVQKKKSRWHLQQKKRYKHAYQRAARGRHYDAGWRVAQPEATGVLQRAGSKKRQIGFTYGRRRKSVPWMAAAVFLFFLAGFSMFAGCSALIRGMSGIAGTTYPGSSEDILLTEEKYLELEDALDRQVNSMEDAHPGYDEYRYQIDEISHDPYHLASYLTVVCPGYTYAQAAGMLQEIFKSQYRLTVEEQTEVRMDPDTGQGREWRVLCISLSNRGLDAVAHERLSPEQEKLYKVYNLTQGCRSGLFGEMGEDGGAGAGSPGVAGPAVPDGALSDIRFANMKKEAEKYLGYPYVWGGSSPQTSFDCSGFVSWVINHCGNGWSVGRQTAEGLRGRCSYVSPEEARPGDLIFFQGTYDTPGASHVGIYAGNNRMIHCGNPVQYAELGAYWNAHFLAYGRLP